MDSSGEDSRDEVKPLIERKTSSTHTRKRSFMDPRSIEVDFNRSARPSLIGKDAYAITLSWEHLNVSVKIPGKRSWTFKEITPPTERQILKDVSGTASPGSLVAIMGASGSGKTTFLNVLTNRNTKDYSITGSFRLNGVEVGEGIKHVSAYVQQNDLFFPTLTVREHLEFRAILRMDKHFDRQARLQRVEEVILEMGLTKCANNRIGTPGGSKKGISGGEKKRLSFASEALTGPPIFFCDEPTSSLDSYMAQTIVHTLQVMAKKGATILCTIHQPSSEIFAMFDKVILLSEGRLAFKGTAQAALDFFEKIQYPCPDNYNPADHYILTLAIEPGREEECRRKTNAICDAFVQSTTNKEELQQSLNLRNSVSDVDRTMVKMVTNFAETNRYESPALTQSRMLFWRSWTSQFRDEMLFRVRIGQTMMLAIVVGLIYLDQDINQTGVMNINGAFFVILTNTTLTISFAVISSLPSEIHTVMRDYGSGLYRLDTYFLAKSLSEIPFTLFCSTAYLVVTYWMIGLNSSFGAFCEALGVVLLVSLIAAAFGYVISIVCGNTQLALNVYTPILMPILLFAGLFLNDDDTPDYFIWLKYISWFKYGYEILMVNQWDDVDHIDCGTNMTCAYRTGQDVLDDNSMDRDAVDEDIGILTAIFFSMYALSFIFLMIRGRRSRE